MVKHRHWFASLWWHFGPYGPQDVHVHSCLYETPGTGEQDCQWVRVGPGRDCDGQSTTHDRLNLAEGTDI